jgi:hypothetical protein
MIEGFLAIAGEDEIELAVSDLTAKLLPDKEFYIRLVINHEYFECHYFLWVD